MIRITAIYKNLDDATFDFDYYLNKHMKLSSDRLKDFGFIGYQVEKGVEALDGTRPDYICITHVDFSSIKDLRAGLKQHAEELMSDIPNYTNIEPHVQMSEVLITR